MGFWQKGAGRPAPRLPDTGLSDPGLPDTGVPDTGLPQHGKDPLMRRLRSATAVLVTVLTLSALVGGCGGDGGSVADADGDQTAQTGQSGQSGGSGQEGQTEDSASTEPRQIEITFDGGTVTPAGDRVEVPLGEPFELVVTADEPGEIHVHSDPEQELEYAGGGQTTTLSLQIDRPGIVEVESHDLEQTIVQLEVR